MMTDLRFGKFPLVILLASFVLACSGGGDGGGDNGGEPVAGIDRGGVVAVGPITGFGSVIVNGVRYSTVGAAITVEGQPALESDLRVGQVVRVEGRVNDDGVTGTASSIAFDDDVEGPVQSLDLAANRFVVLGQTVQVSANTSFDDDIMPRGLEGLALGDRVEVSGLVRSDGVIAATRIERKEASPELEVKGVASNVDRSASRFFINDLQVDYSAAQLEGFTEGEPADGDWLEVHGVLSASGILVASEVERESRELSGDDGDEADIEGLITRFASGSDFDVAGQPVTTTSSTRYRGGTSADLALDVNVEVEGSFDASGRVVADAVEFRRASDVEMAASVESVDSAAGRLVILGVTVIVDERTRFEDHGESEMQRFSLADLQVGDYVEIRGRHEAGTVFASILERDEPEDGVEVRGRASELSAPRFSVVGVSVETTPETDFERGEQDIAAATFFAEANGRTVEVEGEWNGATLVAREVEIEAGEGGTVPPPVEPPPAENGAPVANAGVAQTVVVGSPVNLDGTASSDPDGDSLTYSWVLDVPAASSATLSAAATSQPSFNADAAGSYTAVLTVSDGQLEDTASVVITVRDPAVNTAPNAVAVASKTQAAVGETITLSGAGSSDPEGNTLSYSWSLAVPDGSSAALSSSTAEAPAFTADVAGEYVATLRVSDGELESAPASATVTAQAVVVLDGAQLYSDNCSGCHSPIDAITRMGADKRTAADIQDAIDSNKGGMGFLGSLTADEVQAIADAIAAANP